MKEKIFIALGGNIPNTQGVAQNFCKALLEIAVYCDIISVSSIYETKPWGIQNQKNFLNAVVSANFDGEPDELLSITQKIESEIGRGKSDKWGQRKIDLDIILFGNRVIGEMDLTIPHKYLIFRDFFLIPLLEIEPETVNPVDGRKISEYVERIPDQLKTIIGKKEVSIWQNTITSLSKDR
ncbi:2-amino-4-hydroxy-6-hydroxymethyldihydropteridine diphosphokinase [bacterium]|nr:2-amino-4-hydroxy-6-hydroxymethyldihydropteridine diphosphokinase [bacterium]